ncbi:MAG: TonB family protein [Chthoniobacterales bacterium]|nr:TonB family protein [Chthoniobacterales bacterium]
MTRDARFWRNITIVGLIHVVVLLGLLWWSRSPRAVPKDIVWMEGGAGAESSAAAVPTPEATPESTPVETPEPAEEAPTPEIAPTAKSEIEIPTPPASATPTPRPTSTPTPTPTSTPTPTPKPTPKPTSKPTPKPKPTATPKKKATPKPKPKPTPDEEEKAAAKELEKKKAIAKVALAKEKSGESEEDATSEKPAKKATAADGEESGKAKGSGGSGGKGSGAGGASDVGWYGNMLHDRFYGEWVQPTSVVHSARLSVLLRIRIQKDGRISDYSIAKSSGNPVVDDSVTAAAARVKQVDPLPSGLGGDYYDVNINFELN